MTGRLESFIKAALGLLLVGLCVATGLWFWSKERQENRFDHYIRAAARRYQVDPALIKAVIWQESRFRPDALGRAGEIGLMQIREDAAFEWADHEKIHPFEHRSILNPERNIHAGTFYLSKLMKRYLSTDNPLPYALADYNAGRTHVLRWNKGAARTNSAVFLDQMDYPGTKKYASNVIQRVEAYKSDFRSER